MQKTKISRKKLALRLFLKVHTQGEARDTHDDHENENKKDLFLFKYEYSWILFHASILTAADRWPQSLFQF